MTMPSTMLMACLYIFMCYHDLEDPRPYRLAVFVHGLLAYLCTTMTLASKSTHQVLFDQPIFASSHPLLGMTIMAILDPWPNSKEHVPIDISKAAFLLHGKLASMYPHKTLPCNTHEICLLG